MLRLVAEHHARRADAGRRQRKTEMEGREHRGCDQRWKEEEEEGRREQEEGEEWERGEFCLDLKVGVWETEAGGQPASL